MDVAGVAQLRVAVAGELSYRPDDSVGIDPTVPFGSGLTGSYNKYSVFDTGVNKGFVEEEKWQADINAIYTFSASDPLGFIPSALGASQGFIMAEAVVTHYPGLDTSGKVPYFLPDYSVPNKTSWGYVAEIGMNCMNSMSTSSHPARSAIATPSPVFTIGPELVS